MSFDYGQIEQLWIQFGGNPSAAPMAAAIAMAESGGNPNAQNSANSNGTIDRGLFQINSVHGAQSTFDLASNIRAAIQISNNGSNWQPWSTFSNGAYRRFLTPGASASFMSGSGFVSGQQMLAYGMQFLGKPYVWGGTGPNGFDCSGLMWSIAQHFGLNIPRTSGAQFQSLIPIQPNQVQVGDLIFFDANFSDGNTFQNHVGMYAGNNSVLVADHPGVPVRIVPISSEARISGFGRIPGVINTGSSDGSQSLQNLLASAMGVWGTNGFAVLASLRPTFDMWGGLGIQSPNAASLNENYGITAAVLDSSPELANLYSQAVAGTWTSDEFISQLQQTQWWQTNSDTARKMLALKASDPAQYQRLINDKLALVNEQAARLGVSLSASGAQSLASTALMLNYNDAQINGILSRYLELSKGGHFGGYAGQLELGIREYARDMGVPLTDDYVKSKVQAIIAGTDSLSSARAFIQTTAQSMFPAFEAMIQQGMTTGQIAAPYLAAQSQLWEIDPNKIDLFDPNLRAALQATSTTMGTDQNGNPVVMPLDKFETQLRKNPKWLQTNNARESMMGAAKGILSDFGLQSPTLGQAPQTGKDVTANSRLNFGSLFGMTAFPTLEGQQFQDAAAAAVPPTGAGASGSDSFSASTTIPDVSSLAPQTSFTPTHF